MADSPSRRGFLRGGVGAIGAALVAPRVQAETPPTPSDTPAFSGGGAPGFVDGTSIELTINGTERRFRVGPDEVALDLIRDRLGLTAAKRGCGHGACGACTVLVDGEPRVSCLAPASHLAGCTVKTLEAITPTTGDGLHPVQRAFVAEDALQCGYCTPGFVVEAIVFYDTWRAAHGASKPPPAAVADALAGHLCRCGAHPRVLAAVARACAGEFEAEGSGVGPRVDAVEKVTGRAKYTVDQQLDGQLEAAVFRSPHAHAILQSIDLDALRAAPGVKAVVSYVTVGGRVRFAGQEVVAVAAEDRAAAEHAVESVKATWEVLPAAIGLGGARAVGAALVYPTRGDANKAPSGSEGPVLGAPLAGNVRGPTRLPFAKRAPVPDLVEAARASGNVLTGTWTSHTQSHTTLEPHAAVARWTSDGGLEVWASTQSVADSAEDLAAHYKLRRDQVRLRAEFVGGGFGSKVGMQIEYRIACDLARAANAPVRFVTDRANELAVAGLRPGVETTLTFAWDAQGALAAVQGASFADGGISVGATTANFARLVYDTDYKDLADYDVLSHTPPTKPFRAPGGPALLWALEQAVDAAAWARGEDPVTLRRRWTPLAVRQRLYDWVESIPAWRDRAKTPNADTGRYKRGIGLATGVWIPMVHTGFSVRIDASKDGIVVVSGCQDMGNGSKSVAATAAAETLGIPVSKVKTRFGDSADPHAPMSAGSRTTASLAPAVVDAARALQAALVSVAEDRLGLADVVTAPGGVRHAGGFVSIADLLSNTPPLTVMGRRQRDPGGYFVPFELADTRIVKWLPASVQLTEVEIDTRTGVVRPRRSWTGIAIGHIHVPAIARTQVEGGVVQGTSYALYEERRLDPVTGRTLTTDLESYRIAGLGDVPEMEVHFDETPAEGVLGGGVGLSELSTVAVAASIGNAVYHATGWRPTRMPLRPDQLIEVLS